MSGPHGPHKPFGLKNSDGRFDRATYWRMWCKNNPEKMREYRRRWEAKPRSPRVIATRRRERDYGIAADVYDAMILESCGYCPLCLRQSESEGQLALVVDHDHKSGAVRGLICKDCNTALGYLERRHIGREWAERAVVWLK